ncbi:MULTISPECIES: hypothetical protein [unclassified Leptolyngbya]|uniref:hypothetical protein n=1 Tax=unclassified Leptolyngbya TaxID=2650499 RepID=UPI001684A149|nr:MULTISPECIES: hypothetical protein [unclassified Leptolyngbya]MBD1912639.1 hypothetical protein [Leptolyngbya sp. FACHB-8]MBD2156809.1 hypothetical protein [Leptolyngbya sp. FACHB-16]
MTSDPSDLNPIAATSDSPGDGTRPLLIELSSRRRFVLGYVAVTIISWLIARYLWPLPLRAIPLSDDMVKGLVQGLLTGATVGLGQWLVLRRYIPTWHWIAANALGQIVINLGNELWTNYLIAQSQKDPTAFLETFGGNYAMPLPLAIAGTLPLLFFQWLVLRRYLQRAYAWVLTPFAVTLLSIVFYIFTGLLGSKTNLPIRFATPILIPGLGGIVQAIAFCLFRSKRGVSLSELAEDARPNGKGNRDLLPLLRLALITLLILAGIAALVGSAGIIIEKIQLRS